MIRAALPLVWESLEFSRDCMWRRVNAIAAAGVSRGSRRYSTLGSRPSQLHLCLQSSSHFHPDSYMFLDWFWSPFTLFMHQGLFFIQNWLKCPRYFFGLLCRRPCKLADAPHLANQDFHQSAHFLSMLHSVIHSIHSRSPFTKEVPV